MNKSTVNSTSQPLKNPGATLLCKYFNADITYKRLIPCMNPQAKDYIQWNIGDFTENKEYKYENGYFSK